MAPLPKSLKTRQALAAAMLALVLPLQAQTLGDIEVRSQPGELLDATISLGPAAGASVVTECVFLSRGSAEEGPFVTRASVAVFEAGGARFLSLKSALPVTDRASRLRVVVRCPGQPHVAYREYRALFDPQPAARAADSPASSRLAAAPAPGGAGGGAFPVRPGDTMASLAALLFPRNREVQRAYVEALREQNPSLRALGATDPIPAEAAVELPDLRSLPRARRAESPASDATSARANAPAAAAAARPALAPRVAPEKATPSPRPTPAKRPALPSPSAATPATPASRAPAKPAAAQRRAIEPGERFALRLSSAEVDLSRSRNIDETTRAKLRERLLVLDADDQVAALLSLRDSLKRLEGRVAELQLKLSDLPARPAPSSAAPVPPKVEAAPVESSKPEAPPVTPAPRVEAPRPAKVLGAPPASSVGAALLSDWLWALVALLVLLAGWLAWRVYRRRTRQSEDRLPWIPASGSMPIRPTEPDLGPMDAVVEVASEEPVAVAEPTPTASRRREITSDTELATEVGGADPAALRRRYMEERFPEIANRTIVLTDLDSVIKAARLFYEDGAIPRAVELLHFAIEEDPDPPRPWLALFEILRLERLAGQYADLAQRFRDRHGQTENWRKVQFFGREIDAGNALYRDLSVGIETIRFEAGNTPVAKKFDPIAENWLNAPMDFENELLSVELRRALMEGARLTDDDLVPNPMPALRRVEMFTVA